MILKLLAKEIKDIDNSANFIFIDKEDYEFDFIKTDKELNDYIESKAKPSNNYLFIDEVQEIDRFELILRSYNKKDNEKIYVQVTYLLSEQKTIDMEFGALMNIKDNYPKYVVSFDSFSALNTYKGIKHLTLLEFINNNF